MPTILLKFSCIIESVDLASTSSNSSNYFTRVSTFVYKKKESKLVGNGGLHKLHDPASRPDSNSRCMNHAQSISERGENNWCDHEE
jgi:hypothetical protein